MTPDNKQPGFALLMALIVVSVVVSIGLTVLDLTLKQVRLSTNSKDSETAFHAANAGLECARYWRQAGADEIEVGNDFDFECFGQPTVTVVPDTVPSTNGDAFSYEFELSWGASAANRCSSMTVIAITSDLTSTTTVDVADIIDIIPGYPEGDKECEPNARCTIISVKGYSRACSVISTPGTVEREVLLEL
jgi:Tfp pilus assembly protein PilX